MQDKESEAKRFSNLAKVIQLVTVRARIQSRHSDFRREFNGQVKLTIKLKLNGQAPNMPENMSHSCQRSDLCHAMILLVIVYVSPFSTGCFNGIHWFSVGLP